MAKQNLAPQKGISHVESFKVAGVTFNNRQSNLKKIAEQKQKGKTINLGIEEYEYKGEKAISITANGLDIGNFHREDAQYILNNRERVMGFTDLSIDSFVNEDGKKIIYSRIDLLMKNKTAEKNVQQDIKTENPEVASVQTPPANAKRPFYKNWKFWVIVGAALIVFYIISVITGLAK